MTVRSATTNRQSSKERKLPATALLIGVAAIILVVYLGFLHQDWTKKNTSLIQRLQSAETEGGYEVKKKQFDRLPLIVKRYFTTVLPDLQTGKKEDFRQLQKVKSLRMEQQGTFLLNKRWIHFRAEQHFSAVMSNIGFLWDATMILSSPTPHLPGVGIPNFSAEIPVKVRDAYIDGEGLMEARLLTFLPLANMHDTPEIREGELMRWVAEAVLFPTALLPHEGGGVLWTGDKHDASMATLELTDAKHGATATLHVRFDDDGLISSIQGTRGKAVGDKVVDAPWEGRPSDYKMYDGMMVPTKMEAGWWTDDELEIYFKGENTAFEYEFL